MAAFQNANWYFLVILCAAALYAAAVSVAPKGTAREGFFGSSHKHKHKKKKGGDDGDDGDDDDDDDDGGGDDLKKAKKQHRVVCNMKNKNTYAAAGCHFMMSASSGLDKYQLTKKGNNAGAKQLLKDTKVGLEAKVLANTIDACMTLYGGGMPDQNVNESDVLTKLSAQIDVAMSALKSNPEAGGSKWSI